MYSLKIQDGQTQKEPLDRLRQDSENVAAKIEQISPFRVCVCVYVLVKCISSGQIPVACDCY